MNSSRAVNPFALIGTIALSIAAAGAGMHASAATVVWGTPQTISGDNDVDTSGTLLYAYNLGQSSVTSSTVNGVTFAAFPFPIGASSTTVTVGSVTISESPSFLVSYGSLGSGSGPYGNLSAAYLALLDSGGGAGAPDTLTVTLGGLSSGQDYVFQWWLSNAAPIPPISSVSASATNVVTLDSNLTNTAGGLGQFVIGTFTAGGASETLNFTGIGGWPLINALQVRAVPEPSTCVMTLTGLTCGGYSLFRRRKQT